MAEAVDPEIEAIRAVLAALSPLSEKARSSVLEYVTRRLEVQQGALRSLGAIASRATEGSGAPIATPEPPAHILQFKNLKRPRSANEMAAVVAYFLANIVASSERKATVNQKDMETYFKIAEFPLPQQLRVTLANAKNAGYFDLVGDGEYRLNAVGHNLVAHSMPRGAAKGGKPTRRRRTSGAPQKRSRAVKR